MMILGRKIIPGHGELFMVHLQDASVVKYVDWSYFRSKLHAPLQKKKSLEDWLFYYCFDLFLSFH